MSSDRDGDDTAPRVGDEEPADLGERNSDAHDAGRCYSSVGSMATVKDAKS